jgi:hypothetical protein
VSATAVSGAAEVSGVRPLSGVAEVSWVTPLSGVEPVSAPGPLSGVPPVSCVGVLSAVASPAGTPLSLSWVVSSEQAPDHRAMASTAGIKIFAVFITTSSEMNSGPPRMEHCGPRTRRPGRGAPRPTWSSVWRAGPGDRGAHHAFADGGGHSLPY